MTDNNEKPPVPNYVPNIGRLTTDRFDFQKHINGTAFNHNASAINLSPIITINGDGYTNVQTAIASLAQNLIPPTVNNATTTTLGLIQLSGDITGTATAVRVSGLRGFPIQNLAPTTNQVLQYNGSSWTPASINGWAAPIAASVRSLGSSVHTYTIDSSGSDFFVLCFNYAGPYSNQTINLPAPTLGRVLIIKSAVDTTNQGVVINVVPTASVKIDGLAATYVYTANYGTLRLFSDSTNWWTW